MDDKIIEILGVKKTYDDFELQIDYLCLEKGKIMALIGPNGSGKSTLLKIIATLENPDEGKIFMNGANIFQSKRNMINARKKMAVVFQEAALFSTTVYKNLVLGLKIRKIDLSLVKDKLDYLIMKLKIDKFMNRDINNLSGGEKQKVSIVRSLILNTELLLLDEPFANIDEQSKEDMVETLIEIVGEIGQAVFIVTHEREEVTMLADTIACLNNGKMEYFYERMDAFERLFLKDFKKSFCEEKR